MSYEHIRPHTFPILREILQQHYGRCVDLSAALLEEQVSMSHGELDKAIKTLVKAQVEMRLLERYLEAHFPFDFYTDRTRIRI